MRGGLALIVAATAVAACVDIQVSLIGPQLPARPSGCVLELFPEGKPPFITTDVASASVSCSGARDKCIGALRKQACAVGADTIYGFAESLDSGFTHIDAKFALRVR